MNAAPHPNCSSCLLYMQCETPCIPVAEDTRLAISGKDPSRFPKVMFVGYKPSIQEDMGGSALSAGFESDMLRDYLSILEARWVYTHIIRCSPGVSLAKAEYARSCQHFFEAEVLRHDPQILVPLGKAAFEALWPVELGKAPAITKARTTPTRMPSGRWLLPAYDPNMHRHWLESGGSKGMDLSTEYVRVFTLIDQLLSGTWERQDFTYQMISTQAEMEEFLSFLDRNAITVLDHVDIEDDTWIGGGGDKFSPYKYPELEMDSKLTMWHPDNRLVALGVTIYLDGEYKNYQIHPDLVVKGRDGLPNQNLIRLLRGRHFEAWNSKTELQAFSVYCGVSPDYLIFRNRTTVGDGMLRHGVRDRGNPDGTWNSLKKVAQVMLSAQDWTKDLDDEMSSDRKQSGLPVSSMGRIPVDVMRKYNIGDTYWGARLVRETQLDRNDWPEIPYRTLIEGLPFVCAMERVGVPCNAAKMLKVREEYLRAMEQHKAVLKQQPEFLATAEEVGMPIDSWTPDKVKFFQAFVKRMGEHVYAYTPTKQVSRDQDQVLAWAAEPGDTGLVPHTSEPPVPWEKKTTRQKIWTIWHRITRFKTDSTKFASYADYVVDGRIHPSYWMIRAESGEGAEGAVRGAVSGRFSSTINVQNLFNDMLFRIPFEVHHILPGWVIVALDYSQIELVWVARNTKDELLSSWVRDGVDLHMAKGAKLFVYRTGNSEEVYWSTRSREEFALIGEPSPAQKAWRRAGKTLNFAQTYMQEPETLARSIGVSVEEAYAMCAAEDQMHPRIREAKIEVYNRLQDRDVIVSGWGDRRSSKGWQDSTMPAEVFLSWDPDARNRRNKTNVEIFRSVWNTSIAQGDASMMTFWQGKEIYNRLHTDPNWLNPEWVLPSRFEHDALYWLMPEHYVETAVPELKKMMEDTSRLPVEFPLPLRVGVEVGRNLYEMKEMRV